MCGSVHSRLHVCSQKHVCPSVPKRAQAYVSAPRSLLKQGGRVGRAAHGLLTRGFLSQCPWVTLNEPSSCLPTLPVPQFPLGRGAPYLWLESRGVL